MSDEPLSPKEEAKKKKQEQKAEADRLKKEAAAAKAEAKAETARKKAEEKAAKAAEKAGKKTAVDQSAPEPESGSSCSGIAEASPEEAAAAPPPPSAKAPKSTPPPPPPPKEARKPSIYQGMMDGMVPPPPLDPPTKRPKKYHVELRVKWDYQAQMPDELSVKKGNKIYGFELMEQNQWWYGENMTTKKRGLFPVSYTEPIDSKYRRELLQIVDPAAAQAQAKKTGDASKLKLTLYAHNLGYAVAFFDILLGLFSALWWAERVKGNASLDKQNSLFTVVFIWIYALICGVVVWFYEYQWGLTRVKSDKPLVSPVGIAYIVSGLPLWIGFPTMISASLHIACGFVNCLADYYREEGDANHVKGTYFVVWFDSSEKEGGSKKHREEELTWFDKAREKGVLSQNIFVIVFFTVNIVLMAVAFLNWYNLVSQRLQTCTPQQCPSNFAPVAKMFGQMLNFNCAIILLPVLKSGLRWANNKEVRPGESLATYLPLRKNIIFHRLLASFVAVGAFGHIAAHFVNFAFATEFTLDSFGWFAWLTGAIITFSMVMIYAGAQNRVKRANYEVFWKSHHFFVVFFFMLVAHGPWFWAWSCIPVLLYIADRIYRLKVGNQPFFLKRVLYIPPVMQISFVPSRDFVFKEGQYLYLLAPHLSMGEWHPFTISSAHGDLVQTNDEQKEVTVHIRVQGEKSWTRRLMEYFALMTHSSKKKGESFLLELWHYNTNGEIEHGKYLGPDGFPIISVDGPHAAPAQQYSYYSELMLVGAGIGLTPSSSILKAVCRYKWKKGFMPNVLYLYVVVRHDELESFRWFFNVLVELEKRIASDRHAGALSPQHYIEMNVYVTGAPKPGGPVVEPKQMEMSYSSVHEMNVGYEVDIGFTEEKLMRGLLNPKTSSSKQKAVQGGETSVPDGTKFADVWIWNGRPKWGDIFQCVKDQRDPQTQNIGVCFCGTPVIGKDLKKFCQEKSDLKENFRFDLHKENF